MADIEFTFERSGYLPINLTSDPAGNFSLQSETSGFGVPIVLPIFKRGAGTGATYSGERVDVRMLELGILVTADDRLSLGTLIRKLSNLVRARRNQELPKIVATFSTGEVYEIPFVYTAGLELDYTQSSDTYAFVKLSLTCHDPYWTARDAISFTILNSQSTVGLLPEFAKMQVMASTAIGTTQVNNPGDVDADISWRIIGPGAPSTVQVNGEGFTYNTAIALNDYVNVDGKNKTVLSSAGANLYAGLAAAPKFPVMQPGLNTVSITIVGATAGVSAVTGFYKPRREVIF